MKTSLMMICTGGKKRSSGYFSVIEKERPFSIGWRHRPISKINRLGPLIVKNRSINKFKMIYK